MPAYQSEQSKRRADPMEGMRQYRLTCCESFRGKKITERIKCDEKERDACATDRQRQAAPADEILSGHLIFSFL
jgi:hypothetical protein